MCNKSKSRKISTKKGKNGKTKRNPHDFSREKTFKKQADDWRKMKNTLENSY